MTRIAAPCARLATAATLLTASGLHAAWGRGSTFPFATSTALTDNVVGASRTPSPGACYAVATALAGSAALVALPDTGRIHRRGLASLAVLFGVRALFGFAGRTDLLVPGSSSPAFRSNDRRYFSPICAAVALGISVSLTGRR